MLLSDFFKNNSIQIKPSSLTSLSSNWENIQITGLHDDSRLLDNGHLFIITPQSLPYLSHAIEKKPTAVLIDRKTIRDGKIRSFCEKLSTPIFLCEDILKAQGELSHVFYGRPSDQIDLIGVTGTNGKTTVAWFIYKLWQSLGYRAGMIGTLGAYWGNSTKEHHNKTGYTTPRIWQTQTILAQMVKDKVERVVLEASSEGLDLGRLNGLSFHTAIFTGLGHDHLDHHKNIQSYYKAKKKLFTMCKKNDGRLIISTDDSFGKLLAEEMQEYNAIFTIHQFKNFNNINEPSFIAKNKNLAFEAGTFSQKEKITAKKIIPTIPLPPGRYELFYAKGVHAKKNIYGIVDYAHTPDALERLLSSIREQTSLLACVFGCGGNRDIKKRPLMGRIASQFSDILFLCDDNPREEDPDKIRSDIKKGINKNTLVKEIGDRRKAICKAVDWGKSIAQKPVAIVVVGKGHEEYQIQKNKIIPFSDRKVLQEALDKYN